MSGLLMSHIGLNVIVICVAFSNSQLKDGFCLIKLCVSIYAMKRKRKGNCCLCAHRGAVGLLYSLIVLSIKRERIFFERLIQAFLGPKQETFGFFTFVVSIKSIKSVASLRCSFCDYDISCSNVPVSTKEEVLSVRPSDES